MGANGSSYSVLPTTNPNFFIVKFDGIEHCPKVSLACLRIAVRQFFPHVRNKNGNSFGGNFGYRVEGSASGFCRPIREIALFPKFRQSTCELEVGAFHEPLFDQLQETTELHFRLVQSGLVLGKLFARLANPIALALEQFLKELFHALVGKQVFHDSVHYSSISFRHPNASALAGAFALAHTASAEVVTVFPAFAGLQRHAASACRADRQPRQEDWTAYGSRSDLLWVAGFERSLNAIKFVGLNNRRHGD